MCIIDSGENLSDHLPMGCQLNMCLLADPVVQPVTDTNNDRLVDSPS